MLTKINIYNWCDISHLKIYRDEKTGQYRHKPKCKVCGEEFDCMCYSNILSAINDVRGLWLCGEHYIKEMAHELEIYADIDEVCGTNIEELNRQIYELECGEIQYSSEEFEKLEGDLQNEVNEIINNLTSEQCLEIYSRIDVDSGCEGYACDI